MAKNIYYISHRELSAKPRLILAKSKQQAIAHAAASTFTVERALPVTVATLTNGGIVIEEAGGHVQADLIEDGA
jgi:hypothetical protein